MNREEIKAKIKEIVVKVSGADPDEVTDDVSFTDGLGFDSLTMLEIGVDVDYAFKLNLPDGELPQMVNLGAVTDLVEEALNQRQEAVKSCSDALLSRVSV